MRHPATCPACGFRNLPGTGRCTRCQAQLVLAQRPAPEALQPPRAGWGKRWRPLLYPFYRLRDHLPRRVPDRVRRLVMGEGDIPDEARGAMLLSILPGLGHFWTGRRRRAALALFVALLLAVLRINIPRSATGGWAAGFLFGWHAWVIWDAGPVGRYIQAMGDRLRVMAFILLGLPCLYLPLDHWIQQSLDWPVSNTSVAVYGLERHDRFVVGNRPDLGRALQRGDLVHCRIPQMEFVGQNLRRRQGHRVEVAVLLGLPGDEVVAGPEGLRVNGDAVPPGLLPEGHLKLPKTEVVLTVPAGRCFIAFAMNGVFSGRQTEQLWQQGHLVALTSVEGRIAGIRLPLWHWRDYE